MSKKYHDPLHVPHAELVVHHKGKEALMLNKRLMDQQNCWENLDTIKELHSQRLHLEDKMKRARSKKKLKDYDKQYTAIEFQLQDAWKFDRNINFHRFWNRPGCNCPVLDNEDAYPTGYYVRTAACKIHGDEVRAAVDANEAKYEKMDMNTYPVPDEPEFKLCYVDGAFAYFTTKDLHKQWGDDWNDAPYEHNAGEPYLPHGPDDGIWEIKKVAFDGPFETPADTTGLNSNYSVEDINACAVPWLYSRYSDVKVSIFAGVTIEEFTEKVKRAGGKVYYEQD